MQIRKGFDEKDRSQATAIYLNAFKRKFENLIGEEKLIQGLFEKALDPTYCVCAYEDDKIIGIAGFHEGSHGFVDIKYGDFIKMFGWFYGTWKAVITDMLFTRKPSSTDVFLMDGIAVDSNYRGLGVGSKLFDALISYGQSTGYKYIQLDVIDENPRAKALYERLGFEKKSYERVSSLFSDRIGVSGVTTMVKEL